MYYLKYLYLDCFENGVDWVYKTTRTRAVLFWRHRILRIRGFTSKVREFDWVGDTFYCAKSEWHRSKYMPFWSEKNVISALTGGKNIALSEYFDKEYR